jgi:hypothetical protein
MEVLPAISVGRSYATFLSSLQPDGHWSPELSKTTCYSTMDGLPPEGGTGMDTTQLRLLRGIDSCVDC